MIPKEIHASAIVHKLVAGTAFVKPELQPVAGGTGAELWALGYTGLREARTERIGRPPNGTERNYLQMETVDWVWDTVRTYVDEDGTAIEVSRTIAPMASTVLRSRIDLS
ncbi:hypothetical protein GCM10029976_090670 [Kribbella albertanoniae]